MDEAADWAVQSILQETVAKPLLMMGPNAQLVSLAQNNPRFSQALQASSLNVPDGISVVLAARLLGHSLKERVTGGDLMERLCQQAAIYRFSVFLLGGIPAAAELAARHLQKRYPGLRIAGTYCPPYGFENDAVENARTLQLVRDAAPDLLCVAFGAPRQEIWMHENCPHLPIRAALSVGAALDTQAGLKKRAPRWTHKLGMEWLCRLAAEPRRLWRRYLFGNSRFVLLVLQQLLSGPSSQAQDASESQFHQPGLPS